MLLRFFGVFFLKVFKDIWKVELRIEDWEAYQRLDWEGKQRRFGLWSVDRADRGLRRYLECDVKDVL